MVDDEVQIRRASTINLSRPRVRGRAAATWKRHWSRRLPTRGPRAAGSRLAKFDGVDVIRGLRGWTSIPSSCCLHCDAGRQQGCGTRCRADDYVTKPFSINELLARYEPRSGVPTPRPTTRWSRPATSHRPRQSKVTRAGEPVHLTPTEWGDRRTLARNPGRVGDAAPLLAGRLVAAVQSETNYLRVHLAAIRRSSTPTTGQPRYFITEPGIGYRFVQSLTALLRHHDRSFHRVDGSGARGHFSDLVLLEDDVRGAPTTQARYSSERLCRFPRYQNRWVTAEEQGARGRVAQRSPGPRDARQSHRAPPSFASDKLSSCATRLRRSCASSSRSSGLPRSRSSHNR